MKVQASIRKRCKQCQIVKRGKRLYIYCTSSPSHKQRQG
ncbi:MAG TPA: 50S ribosomal protein L36 [Candidatus Jacksonbacteria bacterium]|nr:50S ribosomal protein L36 [Candidatus Jacksonbacteria bacterium]HCR14757.1 50S ribosomal protein L36 [Candidatus Jacksonbacteria bacterium]